MSQFYTYSVPSAKRKKKSMEDFKGKVVLVVLSDKDGRGVLRVSLVHNLLRREKVRVRDDDVLQCDFHS